MTCIITHHHKQQTSYCSPFYHHINHINLHHINSTALLKDIPKLKSILLYHVVSGVVKPNRNGRTFDTLNGKEISVSEKGDVSHGDDSDEYEL